MVSCDDRKVRWEEMLPDELLAAIDDCPVCYCPYGLAEPHGAYNALGLDWLKADGICERAAKAHGGVVMPPFAWHVQERPDFPWLESRGVTRPLCSSIPPELFLQTVLYQVRAIDARGFHAAVLVTGHYGGPQRDIRLLCDFYARRTDSPLRLLAIADWEVLRYEGYGGDHAGVTETSQLMAIRPDLVDLSRREEASPSGPWVGTTFPDGKGRSPSAELGRAIVGSQVERLGEIQREMLGAYSARDGWSAPTLNDVADLWRDFERLTRKYWTMSLTLDEYKAIDRSGDKRFPWGFPGWDALGE